MDRTFEWFFFDNYRVPSDQSDIKNVQISRRVFREGDLAGWRRLDGLWLEYCTLDASAAKDVVRLIKGGMTCLQITECVMDPTSRTAIYQSLGTSMIEDLTLDDFSVPFKFPSQMNALTLFGNVPVRVARAAAKFIAQSPVEQKRLTLSEIPPDSLAEFKDVRVKHLVIDHDGDSAAVSVVGRFTGSPRVEIETTGHYDPAFVLPLLMNVNIKHLDVTGSNWTDRRPDLNGPRSKETILTALLFLDKIRQELLPRLSFFLF